MKTIKSFPSHKARKVALVFFPQPDTSLRCEMMHAGSVRCALYLFISHFQFLLIVAANGGMARLS